MLAAVRFHNCVARTNVIQHARIRGLAHGPLRHPHLDIFALLFARRQVHAKCGQAKDTARGALERECLVGHCLASRHVGWEQGRGRRVEGVVQLVFFVTSA